MKVNALVLLIMIATIALAGSNQSVDELLSLPFQPDYEGNVMNSCFAPIESKTKCEEFDELGGQPAITIAMKAQAQKWLDEKYPAKPKFYLEKVPKRQLAQDVLMKNRQDVAMKWVNELRTMICDCHCQCTVHNLQPDEFAKIEKDYKALIESRNWKDLGAREPAKSFKAGSWLVNMMQNTICSKIATIYDQILVAKKACYQEFAAKHPEAAQTAKANQRAKKAEKRAMAAEARAIGAEREAAAARREAASAAAMASEANQRAADAESRAAASSW